MQGFLSSRAPRAARAALLALGAVMALAVQAAGVAEAPAAAASATTATATKATASTPSASAKPAEAVNAGAPAGFVAPAEPKADETQAARSKSQPGNNAPYWRAVRGSGEQAGYSSLPGIEKGVLIQSFVQYPGSRLATAGEAWRQVRNRWVIPYGGSVLVIVALALGIFYWRKGPLGGHEPDTGRLVERFTPFERAAHGANAAAFCVLAISGIVMSFGKFFMLPILGGTLFGWLTYALKTAHNFAGPLFAVSLVIVIVTFIRDNLPNKADWEWIKHLGGLLSDHEVPSHRFNAGEKLLFWSGVFAVGLVVVVSGLVLDQVVPGLDNTRSDMQIANLVHGAATALMMTMFMAHIYIGTIGMKGAWKGVSTGYVDEGWAKEHHELWYDDIKAGVIPAQRSKPRDATPPATPTPARAAT
ncbi:MAG: formate dehydrogenase subunit gamma [Leptothrix sp. (in: b-proteobacteria)]